MTPDKKKPAKKTPAPKAAPHTPAEDISPEEQIVGAPLLGKVRAYDEKTREMLLILEVAISIGDAVRVKSRLTDLIQKVERIRVARRCVQSAWPGESASIEVADAVRCGDAVFKVPSA
ncbi:MAG: hypothetical protein AAB262_01240 [Elusimicrobiota bacterium]